MRRYHKATLIGIIFLAFALRLYHGDIQLGQVARRIGFILLPITLTILEQ